MPSLNQILRDAQGGDFDAVEYLIVKYSSLIEKECARFGLWQHPDWSHSDLIQEVTMQIWMKIDQFKGVGCENTNAVFEQWIRSTSHNVLTSLHRQRTAKKRWPEKATKVFDEVTQAYTRIRKPRHSASSIFVNDEEAGRLQRAMAKCLDEKGRLILNLRIVEGLSLKQISERLSLSYDQVRYKFEKSLAALQQQLAQP